MGNEVYFVDSVAIAVEWAQTIAMERYGHFGRIRKVIPGEIKQNHRTVRVQLQFGELREGFTVELEKGRDGWVVHRKKKEKMKYRIPRDMYESFILRRDGAWEEVSMGPLHLSVRWIGVTPPTMELPERTQRKSALVEGYRDTRIGGYIGLSMGVFGNDIHIGSPTENPILHEAAEMFGWDDISSGCDWCLLGADTVEKVKKLRK